MSRHWRPSLGFVIGGGLFGTLCVSLLGLVILRYLGPEIGFRNAAFILALGILVSTSVLGWLMVRLLLRPILLLRDYASGHEAENIAHQPQHYGTREIEQTAKAVISMTETLRDREATIRSFTNHVVHELRTPISAVRAASELLEEGGTLTPDDLQLVQQIDGARQQIEAQLASLRSIAQARETRYIGEASLGEALSPLQVQFPTLTLVYEPSQDFLPMAAEGLQLIFSQLVRNASEHMARQVEFTISESAGRFVLDVKDDGNGISPGNTPHVFEPFYTSRRETGGTGMGLSIVRTVLKAHRANIELLTSPTGAHFRISF